MIIRAGSNASAKNTTGMINQTKIIMNPGDKIFCQLHSGDGITLTAYGITPDQLTQIASAESEGASVHSSQCQSQL